MPFHHEKLKVYQRALEFAGWSQVLIDSLTKRTSTRDHLERAGDSVALNIAEGNGKFSQRDRAKFFQIAHGSALECAAYLDLLVARLCCSLEAIVHGKEILEQIVKMLFKMLDQLGCRIAEDSPEYSSSSSSSASTSSLATTFVRFSKGEKAKRRRLSGRGRGRS
jgi:four helix bundle protein